MHKPTLVFLSLLLSAGSHAAVISYVFEGAIYQPTPYVGGVIPDDFQDGELISGKFSYNSNALPSTRFTIDCSPPLHNPEGECAGYDAVIDFQISIGDSVIRLDKSQGDGLVVVTNNSDWLSVLAGVQDMFIANNNPLRNDDLSAAFSEKVSGSLRLWLRDLDGSVFTDVSLPQSLLFSEFNDSDFFPSGLSLAIRKEGVAGFTIIPVNFTSFTEVPLPTAAWFFLSAVAGLYGFRGYYTK